MRCVIDILLLAAIIVFIVDLSGFTQSWKKWLGKWLGVQIGDVPPFDCRLLAVSDLLDGTDIPSCQGRLLYTDACLPCPCILLHRPDGTDTHGYTRALIRCGALLVETYRQTKIILRWRNLQKTRLHFLSSSSTTSAVPLTPTTSEAWHFQNLRK